LDILSIIKFSLVFKNSVTSGDSSIFLSCIYTAPSAVKSLVQRVGLQRANTIVNLPEFDQKEWAKNMQPFSYLKKKKVSLSYVIYFQVHYKLFRNVFPKLFFLRQQNLVYLIFPAWQQRLL